jgi:hypothetical protein
MRRAFAPKSARSSHPRPIPTPCLLAAAPLACPPAPAVARALRRRRRRPRPSPRRRRRAPAAASSRVTATLLSTFPTSSVRLRFCSACRQPGAVRLRGCRPGAVARTARAGPTLTHAESPAPRGGNGSCARLCLGRRSRRMMAALGRCGGWPEAQCRALRGAMQATLASRLLRALSLTLSPTLRRRLRCTSPPLCATSWCVRAVCVARAAARERGSAVR